MIIAGIDPGLDGAVAFYEPQLNTLSVWDMPTLTIKVGRSEKRKIDSDLLYQMLAIGSPDVAYVEKVGAMPGQGVTSMFSFGFSAGLIEGVLAALEIPREYRTPQEWMKLARCALGKGKDGSRLRASQLFPANAKLFSRKKDNGRSDAVLIAYAGARDRQLT